MAHGTASAAKAEARDEQMLRLAHEGRNKPLLGACRIARGSPMSSTTLGLPAASPILLFTYGAGCEGPHPEHTCSHPRVPPAARCLPDCWGLLLRTSREIAALIALAS